MGVYLNSRNAYTLYKDETAKPYFVDKTRMLEEIFPLLRQGSSYICITRPRRFGKTMATRENDTDTMRAKIKDKKYALRFAPKLGGEVVYTGRILAVGIAYDRVTKEHSCMVEVLRDGI